jgi:hypothetical protein
MIMIGGYRIKLSDCESIQDNVFYTEGSDLGWKPGFFPMVVSTDLGDRELLLMDTTLNDDNGEIYGVQYIQPSTGLTVQVFND